MLRSKLRYFQTVVACIYHALMNAFHLITQNDGEARNVLFPTPSCREGLQLSASFSLFNGISVVTLPFQLLNSLIGRLEITPIN